MMSEPDLIQLRQNFLNARKALAEAQKYRNPESVDDYQFTTGAPGTKGSHVSLSELFKSKTDLFVIHNMGISCTYCTLWADGLNGVFQHLTDRAAFVIASPDPVDVQQSFKATRKWKFDMVSTSETTFTKDMGYENEQGHHPGVSVFSKTRDGIYRVADTPFGPGDDFCAVWHLFDLLPGSTDDWQPKLSYQ